MHISLVSPDVRTCFQSFTALSIRNPCIRILGLMPQLIRIQRHINSELLTCHYVTLNRRHHLFICTLFLLGANQLTSHYFTCTGYRNFKGKWSSRIEFLIELTYSVWVRSIIQSHFLNWILSNVFQIWTFFDEWIELIIYIHCLDQIPLNVMYI